MRTEYYWRDILNVKQLERIANDLRGRIKTNAALMANINEVWHKLKREEKISSSRRYKRYEKIGEDYATEMSKLNYHIQVLKIKRA